VNRSRKTFVACASALAITACGAAAEESTEAAAAPVAPRAQLAVKDAWARAADSGANASVYFTITNTAAASDTLASARSAVAEEVGLHMSMMHGNTMHMAGLQSLPVPAYDSVLFVPLGAHVMLTRTTRPLTAGDTVPLTLTFVSGQTIEVRAGVRLP
jgi:periplasmic copper chaperone A